MWKSQTQRATLSAAEIKYTHTHMHAHTHNKVNTSNDDEIGVKKNQSKRHKQNKS